MRPPTASDVGEIHLLSIGPLPRGTADALALRLSRRLGVACRLRAASADPLPPLPGRDQVHADALLASLEAGAPSGAAVLGITASDIGIPIFTFVFGRARVGGRAAVVSLARLDPAFYGLPPSEDVLLARAEAEAVHELGHVAGLGHCRDSFCLMAFAGNVEKADARGAEFCPACAARLPPWLRSLHEPLPRV